MQDHVGLLPKPITNAQLFGLANLVGQTPAFSHIREFIKNRQDRAAKLDGKEKVTAYWGELLKDLEGLKKHAESLFESFTDQERKASLRKDGIDYLHVRLSCEYVTHLVSNSLYKAEKPDK